MNDEALIKRAQNGDARAFETLLETHYEVMFKFAFKWCGNRDDAQDVTQQACIKLARVLGQFRFESSFISWLYRLVINCAKDWHKSQARHQRCRDGIQHYPQAQSSDDRVDHALLAQQLLDHLGKLPDGMKETVLLVHSEGFTHGEAAKILDVKESTISWRIHEIRKRFRSIFGQEELL